MIENSPRNFEPSQEEKRPKPEPELEFENLELDELKEKELCESFAKELRKPYEKSYFKKLQRIASAFVLAGLVTLAAPEKATLPEKSKEFKEFEALEYYQKTDPKIYQKTMEDLLAKIKEKGGIKFSPQLPAEIFKPSGLSFEARMGALVSRDEKPYFSNPEIIFGEDFVKKNPEKAKEYFEKISKTQKATVIINSETSMGSGIMINTEKGKIILTNDHVIRGKKNVWATLINGCGVDVKLINADSQRDIAILKIVLPEKYKDKEDAIFKNTNSLDLDPDVKLRCLEPKDHLALVGHPRGYPFEVSLAEAEMVESESVQKENQNGFVDTKIISKPDERFAKLASYDISPNLSEKMGHGSA